MYLKEIKLYGFKSFADKINIELSKSLNGIVGPNGSGKSNIVDAVRWVLGEQSMKSLRGDSSLDVIFSGSKTRRPLNSASVTLVFDNVDRVIPLDFDEVSIKRVLYRNGENEYYINLEKCRLKDITELLTDTGGSKESFNIISQGKIDEIISTKPNERRVIFDEASGSLKYKRRKEEALRKLERTNDNLTRINDILLELERTLKPLEIEKDKANLFIKTKEELKDVEISLMTNDIEKCNYEYSVLKDKIKDLEDEIIELSKNNTNYDIELLKEKDSVKNIDSLISEKHNLLLDKVKSLESVKKDIELLLERNKLLKNSNDIDNKIINIKSTINKLKLEYSNFDNEIEINNKKKENYTLELEKKEKALTLLKEKVFKLNTNINNYNIEENKLKYKIEYLENSISNNNSMPSAIKQIISNPLFNGVHNIVGKLIKIDEIYIDCINTSLMSSTNHLVVDSKVVATKLVEFLKKNKLGRATFLPLDVITPRYVDDYSLEKIKSEEGFVATADTLVSYDDKYKNIILNLLGNIIVAKDIESANKISLIVNKKYKVVTLDGQVVNVGGSITGGSKINVNSAIKEKYDLDDSKRKYEIVLENIKKVNEEISRINKDKQLLENDIYSLKVNVSEINEIIKIKNNSLFEVKNKLNVSEKELQDLESISLNSADDVSNKLFVDSNRLELEINNLKSEIDLLNIDKDTKEKNILDLENLSKGSNNVILKKEKEKNSHEIRINRLEVTIDNLLLGLNEEYGITFEYAKEYFKLEIDEDLARSKVINLKNKIKEIGVVNLGSPEEYDRINERYNFLMNQKNDLLNAEDTLINIINEMDEIMKDRFKTTFEKIQVEFKKVFRDLFKGGNASLELTDPDNLLETGVEITAEPPGKKLQNISLLSGGEKTFTAISLLFAILNVRPVPFCLLDEVEAALDDANVESFGEYLKNYNNTQFILITHKKKTMEFINVLYGITMQESGVSKLVSVKLEDLKNRKYE